KRCQATALQIRFARFTRTFAGRLARAPSCQPSAWASSTRLFPSRQHSTNGARCFFGKRSSFPSSRLGTHVREALLPVESLDELQSPPRGCEAELRGVAFPSGSLGTRARGRGLALDF